jgi:hypothetical protein
MMPTCEARLEAGLDALALSGGVVTGVGGWLRRSSSILLIASASASWPSAPSAGTDGAFGTGGAVAGGAGAGFLAVRGLRRGDLESGEREPGERVPGDLERGDWVPDVAIGTEPAFVLGTSGGGMPLIALCVVGVSRRVEDERERQG